jgi:hypothetical protein
MLRYREFEVAELSLSSYTVSLFGEQQTFIAIPVLPSRFFPALLLLRQRHARIPDDCDTFADQVLRRADVGVGAN